mgnify:CR=1 FL=1
MNITVNNKILNFDIESVVLENKFRDILDYCVWNMKPFEQLCKERGTDDIGEIYNYIKTKT